MTDADDLDFFEWWVRSGMEDIVSSNHNSQYQKLLTRVALYAWRAAKKQQEDQETPCRTR